MHHGVAFDVSMIFNVFSVNIKSHADEYPFSTFSFFADIALLQIESFRLKYEGKALT